MSVESHLVIAPHPDDELLGCGGSVLRAKAEGDEIHWATVTEAKAEYGFSQDRVRSRQSEIAQVVTGMEFDSHVSLGFQPAGLNDSQLGDVIASMAGLIEAVQPSIVYLPFAGDVHSDHRMVFNAGMACSKWFRHPSIRKVLSYEIISETDMSLAPGMKFEPNYFVDISNYIDRKLALLKIYESELGEFPFPRSQEAVNALATVRGASSGYHAAEAFMILRERI
jgi:LmbE family N-acetylglucosaminyl deacetylase